MRPYRSQCRLYSRWAPKPCSAAPAAGIRDRDCNHPRAQRGVMPVLGSAQQCVNERRTEGDPEEHDGRSPEPVVSCPMMPAGFAVIARLTFDPILGEVRAKLFDGVVADRYGGTFGCHV